MGWLGFVTTIFFIPYPITTVWGGGGADYAHHILLTQPIFRPFRRTWLISIQLYSAENAISSTKQLTIKCKLIKNRCKTKVVYIFKTVRYNLISCLSGH